MFSFECYRHGNLFHACNSKGNLSMTMLFSQMSRDDRRNLQMALNEKTPARLVVDGDFGGKSVIALKAFQAKSGLIQSGLFDDATQALLSSHMKTKYLNEEHYVAAALALGCEVAAIKAVVEVEAAGDGFLPDGRCDILFERHKFYKAIAAKKGAAEAQRLMVQYPNICNTETGGYKGDENEYPRLAIAEGIDLECARASASWGMCQIMGFNYASCGYTSATAFSNDMKLSEPKQLMAFVNFIKANPTLLSAIRNKQWAVFAKNYNGTQYFVHKYDVRMGNAYAVHAKLA